MCATCAAPVWHANLTTEGVQSLLTSILSAITGGSVKQSQAAQERIPDIVCPSCGCTFARYKASGRLGCAACYSAFREQLLPVLRELHGATDHVGRRPLMDSAAQACRSKAEEIMQQMEQAVAREDFETAAFLRDQLRRLSGREADA